jgi:hypothetical protein
MFLKSVEFLPGDVGLTVKAEEEKRTEVDLRWNMGKEHT